MKCPILIVIKLNKIWKNLSEFVPELVEAGIVRAMDIMAKLMKHCIKNLIKGEEIPISVRPPQPQLHMQPASHIQPQQRRVARTAILLIYNYHSIRKAKHYKLR